MPVDLYRDADRPSVLLVGGGHDRAAFQDAAEAAGGRVAGSVEWSDLPDDAHVQLVVAAIDDLADDAVLPSCSGLIELVDAANCAAIVTLRESQIDAAAGVLLETRTELLCGAGAGILAGSIALALARRSGIIADTVREGEDSRLRRLNEEVARIAKLLARLSEGDTGGSHVADRISGFGAPPRLADPVHATDIRNAIRARRLRDQHFMPNLFEDPAWDMLLDLYAAELEGGQVSVSSLCIAAAVPPTTALRWITKLTEAGLFERRPDPFDRRRAFLGLTADARERMDRHFAALAAAGLPIG
jgi:DNA-binding MarR family transcriptional regulator